MDFGDIISDFQYAICSRYHAIIHAYKKYIPCIVIGWAEKFKELLESFDQGQYLFYIRDQFNSEAVLVAIEVIDKINMMESIRIAKHLSEIQIKNCSGVLQDLWNRVMRRTL